MRSKKKKTKRNQAKYPALDKTYNLKTRQDMLDYDYVNGYNDEETGGSIRPLTPKEKQWLNDFTEEYVHANFKPDRKRIHRKKKAEHPKNASLKKITKVLVEYIKSMTQTVNDSDITNISKGNLRRAISKFRTELKKKIKKEMKTIEDYYKTDAFNSNNNRNRCILTKAKAQGKLISTDDLRSNYDSLDINESENEVIEELDFTEKFTDSVDEPNDN